MKSDRKVGLESQPDQNKKQMRKDMCYETRYFRIWSINCPVKTQGADLNVYVQAALAKQEKISDVMTGTF